MCVACVSARAAQIWQSTFLFRASFSMIILINEVEQYLYHSLNLSEKKNSERKKLHQQNMESSNKKTNNPSRSEPLQCGHGKPKPKPKPKPFSKKGHRNTEQNIGWCVYYMNIIINIESCEKRCATVKHS